MITEIAGAESKEQEPAFSRRTPGHLSVLALLLEASASLHREDKQHCGEKDVSL